MWFRVFLKYTWIWTLEDSNEEPDPIGGRIGPRICGIITRIEHWMNVCVIHSQIQSKAPTDCSAPSHCNRGNGNMSLPHRSEGQIGDVTEFVRDALSNCKNSH